MPSVYIGTPGEVKTALERCGAEAVILLMFPHMETSTAHKVLRGFREVVSQAAARCGVLESGDWLTTAEVASLSGMKDTRSESRVRGWKRRGLIFAIRHKGKDYFPLYALAADDDFRPCPHRPGVLKLFAEHKDGWGTAYWFQSPNSHLGGRRPKDLLASQPDRMIFAACQDAQLVTHG